MLQCRQAQLDLVSISVTSPGRPVFENTNTMTSPDQPGLWKAQIDSLVVHQLFLKIGHNGTYSSILLVLVIESSGIHSLPSRRVLSVCHDCLNWRQRTPLWQSNVDCDQMQRAFLGSPIFSTSRTNFLPTRPIGARACCDSSFPFRRWIWRERHFTAGCQQTAGWRWSQTCNNPVYCHEYTGVHGFVVPHWGTIT